MEMFDDTATSVERDTYNITVYVFHKFRFGAFQVH